MNKMLVAVLCGAFGLLTLGCRQQKSFPTKQPELSITPITGAFGWTLGEKLPETCEMEPYKGVGSYPPTFTFYDKDKTNEEPFGIVTISCLRDRTIYQITTDAIGKYKSAVLTALVSKYGPCKTNNLNTSAEGYDWRNGDCLLHVMAPSEDIFLIWYQNTAILDTYRAQLEKESQDQIKSVSSNLAPKL